MGILFPKLTGGLDAAETGHVDVHDHQVKGIGVVREKCRGVLKFPDLAGFAAFLKKVLNIRAQLRSVVPVVVHQRDPHETQLLSALWSIIAEKPAVSNQICQRKRQICQRGFLLKKTVVR